ncbi:MAG TPA: TonB-dependent receptor [Chitinophagaceae bacterium]|nr:TonB-dependent receptor [Chitinophagaceae bacterium]
MKTIFFTPKVFIFLLVLPFNLSAYCQQDSSNEVSLQEVVIKAFEQNQKLKNVPAAVNYVGRQALERFSPASIVSAINSTPGVRMEERSPGSYRINIRGSSLRSPFGVRNVKVYYNGLPFTDPGGHTYLNALGYYNFNSIEIIKGPGSSLYGTGTGGAMLIESLSGNEENGITGEYAFGSYGMKNSYVSFTTGNDKYKSKVGYQHQTADGYRKQSNLRRDVVSWNAILNPSVNQQLKVSLLYSDLYYETPGALTLTEFTKDPSMARPSAGLFPSAEQSKAAIYQKSFLAGASFTQRFFDKLSNTTSLYGMYTDLRNPTIRNYGHSSEPHFGGRTVFTFQQPFNKGSFTINTGGEWQQNLTSFSIHKNLGGIADSMQSFDEAHNRQSFLFAQASIHYFDWVLTAGTSLNETTLKFRRYVPTPIPQQFRSFDNELASRLALLKNIKGVTLYTSIAKGFSPPTTSELLPTGSTINLDLQPEHGINYDLGFRADFHNVYIDVNAFLFSLNNTIVQRRDAGGGDYFINAGKTKQKGIETYLSYTLFDASPGVENSLFWISHTFHSFQYKNFKQLTSDFSGNRLPGNASHTFSSGTDFLANNGLLAALTYYYSDKIPLSDANDVFADDYHLLGGKIGYQKWLKDKIRIKIFIGVDNILNERYSLGNDLNGFGGRYYNAAPLRNYYAGIVLQAKTKKSNDVSRP